MREEEMKTAQRTVLRLFPKAECLKVSVAGKQDFWIVRDHVVPSEVLGNGSIPYEAWMDAATKLN